MIPSIREPQIYPLIIRILARGTRLVYLPQSSGLFVCLFQLVISSGQLLNFFEMVESEFSETSAGCTALAK
jgi:hypothetical protein